MKVTDPVCGMTIDSKDAAAEIKHEGKAYFFCSTHCRDEFEQSPQRYTQAKAKQADAVATSTDVNDPGDIGAEDE